MNDIHSSIIASAASCGGNPPTPVPNAGKRNAADSQLMRPHERILRRLPDFELICGEILSHHSGMNDVFGREGAAARHDGLTNLHRTLSYRLAFDIRATRPFQRSRDARAHPQVIVGRVHNRIDLRLADVPALRFERGFPHPDDHTLIIRLRFCFVETRKISLTY